MTDATPDKSYQNLTTSIDPMLMADHLEDVIVALEAALKIGVDWAAQRVAIRRALLDCRAVHAMARNMQKRMVAERDARDDANATICKKLDLDTHDAQANREARSSRLHPDDEGARGGMRSRYEVGT